MQSCSAVIAFEFAEKAFACYHSNEPFFTAVHSCGSVYYVLTRWRCLLLLWMKSFRVTIQMKAVIAQCCDDVYYGEHGGYTVSVCG